MRASRKKTRLNQVVIFCGGFGKRLGKISQKIAKPLIKIDDKPFLDYLIENFSSYKFKNIILLCGYKSEQFKKYNNKIINGSKVNCINEKKPLGNAGALFNAKKKLKDRFLITNGDTYFNIDFNSLNSHLINKKFIGIIAGYKVNTNKNKLFDNLIIKNKIIKKIVPKNKNHNIINSGIAIFSKEIIKYISKDNFSLEKEIYPKLILKNKLKAVCFKNNFIDIGTKKDLNFIKKNSDFFLNKHNEYNKFKIKELI